MQSESPSASKLNNLGGYLLVSLFFVITALIEFAVVLLIQRKLNVNLGDTHNKITEDPGRKANQKIYDTSLMDNNAEYIPTMFEPTQEKSKPEDESNENTKKLGSIQLLTGKIDMIACILFILFYVLFIYFVRICNYI